MGRGLRGVVVACIGLSLVVPSMPPGVRGATQASETLTRSDDFLEVAREMRAAAIKQAGGCQDVPPDQLADCKSYKPNDLGYATDRVIVGLRDVRSASAQASQHDARVRDFIGSSSHVTFDVPEGKDPKDFVTELKKDRDIAFAELDHKVQAFQEQSQINEWGIGAIRADVAQTNGYTGASTTVAIVDTGVDYTHVDLRDNIVKNLTEENGTEGVDDDGNGYVDDVYGYDFAGEFSIAGDNDPMDVYGHGTHVAGIVAAQDNGFGVKGVAPDAGILAVKVLDDFGWGFDSKIAEGIYYAVDNGAHIINMSLGGYGRSTLMRNAVEYAHDNGVMVVAAAGNSWFYSLPSFPAAFPSVLSVAAAPDSDPSIADEDLTKQWWSDWGHADYLAPGVNVLSTTPDNTYERFSGTSMAAPHVAGALAVTRDAMIDNGFTGAQVQVEQVLAATARDHYFAGTDEVTGFGLPDLDAATTYPMGTTVVVNRERYLIPSNGDALAPVTVRILDSSLGFVAGESITWSTDKGTFDSAETVTDGSGEATAFLEVDDDYGVATVTSDPVSHPARSARVIVEDDRIRVDDAELQAVFDDDCWDCECDGYCEEPSHGSGGEDGLYVFGPEPGDDVVMHVYLGQHDFSFPSEKIRSVEWTIDDANGDPVPDLTGELDPVWIFGFGSQLSFESEPMTIPEDAPTGKWTMTVTATTDATGETHTLTKEFNVGTTNAEVLIVPPSTFGFFDAETFNYLWEHQVDLPVRRALEAENITYNVWDGGFDDFFFDDFRFFASMPPLEVMQQHAVVVIQGGWIDTLDLGTLREYIEGGGNALVTGSQFATNARFSSGDTKRYRELFGASPFLTTFFPDDNHQQNPQMVSFGDTPYDALDALDDVDLGAFDLNHTGQSSAIFTDELKRFGIDTEILATYPNGTNATNGFEAGTARDTGVGRFVNLGFGIEAINGNAEIAEALLEMFDFFEPAPSIAGQAVPKKVSNNGKGSFLITGDEFQTGGTTTVLLDGIEMAKVTVVDREHIRVRVPKKFQTGTYDITIINPDGENDTFPNGVKIVKRR